MHNDFASIVYVPNPLQPQKDRVIEQLGFADSTTVSIRGFLDAREDLKFTLPTICLHNGEPVLRTEWADTQIHPNDVVMFLTLPQGGGGDEGGKDIMRMVLMVGLMLAAPHMAIAMSSALGSAAVTAVTIEAGTMMAMAAQGAVIIGGTLIINAVLPPATPAAADHTDISPTYTLGARNNAVRTNSPIPVIYGKHRVWPDYIAHPYTTYRGQQPLGSGGRLNSSEVPLDGAAAATQELFQMMCIGQGTYVINEVLIGGSVVGHTVGNTLTSTHSEVKLRVYGPTDSIVGNELFPQNRVPVSGISRNELEAPDVGWDDGDGVGVVGHVAPRNLITLKPHFNKYFTIRAIGVPDGVTGEQEITVAQFDDDGATPLELQWVQDEFVGMQVFFGGGQEKVASATDKPRRVRYRVDPRDSVDDWITASNHNAWHELMTQDTRLRTIVANSPTTGTGNGTIRFSEGYESASSQLSQPPTTGSAISPAVTLGNHPINCIGGSNASGPPGCGTGGPDYPGNIACSATGQNEWGNTQDHYVVAADNHGLVHGQTFTLAGAEGSGPGPPSTTALTNEEAAIVNQTHVVTNISDDGNRFEFYVGDTPLGLADPQSLSQNTTNWVGVGGNSVTLEADGYWETREYWRPTVASGQQTNGINSNRCHIRNDYIGPFNVSAPNHPIFGLSVDYGGAPMEFSRKGGRFALGVGVRFEIQRIDENGNIYNSSSPDWLDDMQTFNTVSGLWENPDGTSPYATWGGVTREQAYAFEKGSPPRVGQWITVGRTFQGYTSSHISTPQGTHSDRFWIHMHGAARVASRNATIGMYGPTIRDTPVLLTSEYDFRGVGSAGPESWGMAPSSLSNATNEDLMGYGYLIPEGRYRIRGRRTTHGFGPDVSTAGSDNDGTLVSDKVYWLGAVGYILGSVKAYAGVTTLATKVIASRQFNQNADTDLSVLVSRKLPMWGNAISPATTIGSNPITTAGGSTTATVTYDSHGLVVGQSVTIAGVSGTGAPAVINGVPITDINGARTITTVTADTFGFTTLTTANATSTDGAGGSSVTLAASAFWSDDLVTSNPAWAFYDAATNTDYGGGVSPSLLNLPDLRRLATLWGRRGDEFNGVFDTTRTLWDALNSIARAGRGRALFVGGKLTIVRDEDQSVYTAMYSMENIKQGSFSIDYAFQTPQSPDFIEVEYMSDVTWKPTSVECYLNIAGETSAGQVWLLATNAKAKNVVLGNGTTFTSDMLGGVIRLTDEALYVYLEITEIVSATELHVAKPYLDGNNLSRSLGTSTAAVGYTIYKPKKDRAAKVKMFGITDRDQAWREGIYQAAVNRYQRKMISFTTDFEGHLPIVGDKILIQHEQPGVWGQTGELIDYDTTEAGTFVVRTDPAIDWGIGNDLFAAVTGDGDFESDIIGEIPSGWLRSGAGSAISVTEDDAYKGTRCVKISYTDNAQTWAYLMQHDVMASLAQGTQYTVSAWMKAANTEAEGQTVSIGLKENGSGAFTGTVGMAVASLTEWKKITWTGALEVSGATTLPVLHVGVSEAFGASLVDGQAVYVDDVQVYYSGGSAKFDTGYAIAFKKPNGEVAGPFFSSNAGIERGATDNEVIVTGDGFVGWTPITQQGPKERTQWVFGTTEEFALDAKVTEIQPRGINEVTVKAANDSPLVYTADTEVTHVAPIEDADLQDTTPAVPVIPENTLSVTVVETNTVPPVRTVSATWGHAPGAEEYIVEMGTGRPDEITIGTQADAGTFVEDQTVYIYGEKYATSMTVGVGWDDTNDRILLFNAPGTAAVTRFENMGFRVGDYIWMTGFSSYTLSPLDPPVASNSVINSRRLRIVEIDGAGGVAINRSTTHGEKATNVTTTLYVQLGTGEVLQPQGDGEQQNLRIRRANPIAVTSSIDADANKFTVTGGHNLFNDTTVYVHSTATLPGGVSSGVTYYVVNADNTTFKLSTSIGGGALSISSTGSGIITVGDLLLVAKDTDPDTAWQYTLNAGDWPTYTGYGEGATVRATDLLAGAYVADMIISQSNTVWLQTNTAPIHDVTFRFVDKIQTTTIAFPMVEEVDVLAAILTGTATVAFGDAEITGVGTSFTEELAVGDEVLIGGEVYTVSAIGSDTTLTLSEPYEAEHSTGSEFTPVAANSGISIRAFTAANKSFNATSIRAEVITLRVTPVGQLFGVARYADAQVIVEKVSGALVFDSSTGALSTTDTATVDAIFDGGSY